MQNQSNTEQFLKLPYDLLATTSFVSSTGEIVEITLQQKVIYCWMKQRCEFFTRENKEYFDTLESVAAGLSIDRKTVMRAIDFFTKHGVLIAEKRKAIGTRQKWFFKRFNNLVLVQKENIASKASNSPQVERSEESNTNAKTAEYVEPELAGEAWVHEVIPEYDYEYYEPSVDDQDMDSNYYNPEDLKEKTEDDVDEPSFMKVKATIQERVKPTSSGFTPLPSELFNRKGDDLSDKMYDWVDRNGIYYRGANNFVANLFHNATDTNYVIKNGKLVNMGVEKEEEELLPF